MDNNTSLTDRIRGWFERSPKAQRAYQRLSTDLDTVVERVDSATSGLRDRIAPIIDPSRPTPAAQTEQDAVRSPEAAAASPGPGPETEPTEQQRP